MHTHGLSVFPSLISPFLQDKTNHVVHLIPEMWNSINALMFILACQIRMKS